MLEKLWIVLRVKILWQHNGPFGSLSSHYSYFFKGARPSFSGLMCYPRFLRMLGFDRSCISFSFLARWSFYSSWCGGKCKISICPSQVALQDTHVMLLEVVQSHVLPFKSLVVQSYPQCSFLWWTNYTSKNLFHFSIHSFRCCASTFILLCRSNNKGLIISSS
jgi:hypothetical protein